MVLFHYPKRYRTTHGAPISAGLISKINDCIRWNDPQGNNKQNASKALLRVSLSTRFLMDLTSRLIRQVLRSACIASNQQLFSRNTRGTLSMKLYANAATIALLATLAQQCGAVDSTVRGQIHPLEVCFQLIVVRSHLSGRAPNVTAIPNILLALHRSPHTFPSIFNKTAQAPGHAKALADANILRSLGRDALVQ